MDPARRQAYLRALGIPLLVRRDPTIDAVAEPVAEPAAGPAAAPLPEKAGAGGSQVAAYAVSAPAMAPVASPRADRDARPDWDSLRRQVSQCRACTLHEARTQAVLGAGDLQADLMIIGEAPGAEEDRQGEPFVGSAGQLLTAMLRAIGLTREQVYITNVVKCRPPGNRKPTAEEVTACRGYLQHQIDLVGPRLILSLGAVSAHGLLDSDDPVGRLRLRTHIFGQSRTPLLVSYHPAYLLRKPAEKAKAWVDLQQVARLLG